jgi:ribonucleoside-diphosphate reductase alpha chain
MDYIFRWIQIRFLSGHQLDLFAGLTPQHSIPVEGIVNAPGNTITGTVTSPQNAVIPSERIESKDPEGLNPATGSLNLSASTAGAEYDYHFTTPPQQGIAPDLSARSGLESSTSSMEDRGIYHAADAMKSMYDMGDAPSCATCGAIMTRSGSCYRCMSCGSTSGCS